MEEEELRRLWYEWANIAITGDYGRLRDGVEAAIQAIRGGANQEQAVAAAEAAAARWSQTKVYSPPVGQVPGAPAGAAADALPQHVLPDILPPALEPVASTGMAAVVGAAEPAGAAGPSVPAAGAPRRLIDNPFVLAGIGGGAIVVLLIVAVVALAFGGNGNSPQVASSSADKIVSDAALIVGSWSSYHAHLQAQSGQGSADVKYADSTSMSIDTTKADTHVQLLTTSNRYFIAGNAAFYKNNPVLAQHAAERWIEVKGSTSLLSPADSAPAVGANCILQTHGTLTKKGALTVNGRKAIEIDDAGDKPGTTPAKLFIATDGRLDLLRVEETGVTNGTPDKRCVNGFGSAITNRSALATVDFDQINGHIDVSVPSGVVNLDDPPFCGTPVSQDLSVAAQQFLLLLYDGYVRDAKIAAECGCPTPRFDQFHQAMVDILANDTAYMNGLLQLPLDPTQRAVADKAVVAFKPLIANDTAQAQAGSFAQAQPLYDAHDQLSQAAGDAAQVLHQALGVPADTCSFDAPS